MKIRSKKSLETPILKISRAVQMRKGGGGRSRIFVSLARWPVYDPCGLFFDSNHLEVMTKNEFDPRKS